MHCIAAKIMATTFYMSEHTITHVSRQPFPSVALFAVTDHYDDDMHIYIVNRKILPEWEEKV